MTIYRSGTFVVPAANAATTLNLGFIPSVFKCYDVTLAVAGAPSATAGGASAYWDTTLGALSTPVTLLVTTTTGTSTSKSLTTTGISPFQSADPNLFLPNQAPYTTTTGDRAYIQQSTVQVIATTGNITQAASALVTTGDAHSFTSSDIGVTVVTFHGVPGMTQINGLSGVILSVPTTTTFTVSINTSNFSAYNSAGKTQGVNSGFINVITGAPVNTLYGNSLLPTAEANLGFIGLTIGTGVMGATGVTAADVFFYEAILQSPATGP